MTKEWALELMRSAWATRRASFDVSPAERRAALTKARKELATAVSLCRDYGSEVSYAQAVHLLANVELDLGHECEALSLWEEAVSVLRKTDDVLELAHKVRHLGDLHRHWGRLEEAESCYSEALALYREHDSPGSLDFANAVSRMADLKERGGENSEALVLWRESRKLYAAVNLLPGVEEAERHNRTPHFMKSGRIADSVPVSSTGLAGLDEEQANKGAASKSREKSHRSCAVDHPGAVVRYGNLFLAALCVALLGCKTTWPVWGGETRDGRIAVAQCQDEVFFDLPAGTRQLGLASPDNCSAWYVRGDFKAGFLFGTEAGSSCRSPDLRTELSLGGCEGHYVECVDEDGRSRIAVQVYGGGKALHAFATFTSPKGERQARSFIESIRVGADG